MSEADASSAEAARSGRPGPVRGLLAASIEAAATRLELVTVEVELHLLETVRVVLWALAAMLCALAALAFALVTLIAALWDTHRMLGLVTGALSFAVLTVVCTLLGARAFRNRPGLLSGTLAELDADHRRTRGAP
ncbi:MAG TPA: phage holin family protein [Steroidobacteraceae bacterium]|nr:phage holin family protein [Steroidobacteraceae bacterium]